MSERIQTIITQWGKKLFVRDYGGKVVSIIDQTGKIETLDDGQANFVIQELASAVIQEQAQTQEAMRGRDALMAGHYQPTASQAEREIKALRAALRDIHEAATDATDTDAALLLIAGMARDAHE